LPQSAGDGTRVINDNVEPGEGLAGGHAYKGADREEEESETENNVEDNFVAHLRKIGARGCRRWSGLRDWHCRRRKGEKYGNDHGGGGDE